MIIYGDDPKFHIAGVSVVKTPAETAGFCLPDGPSFGLWDITRIHSTACSGLSGKKIS